MKCVDVYETVTNSRNHTYGHGDEPNKYRTGAVMTAYGIVDCYTQNDWSQLRFMVGNHLYRRTFEQGYTKRGLAKIAKDFAREITEKEKSDE